MASLLLKNCLAIITAADEEPRRGEDLLIRGRRVAAIGPGLADGPARTIDCSGCVVVPGLVNTHHHFYQTLTRCLPAVQNAPLFDWLRHLYGIWQHLDAEAVRVGSLLAMGELLKTGCTTAADHHYVYPAGVNDDLTGIQVAAAALCGIRFAPARGSMSLGQKDGGLPPDTVVQTEEQILADCARVIDCYHDPGELSMVRIQLGPCSPFSVTRGLLARTVRLARDKGV